MKFAHLMNRPVLILTPLFGQGKDLLRATVIDIDVDAQGIWVEEKELMGNLLGMTGDDTIASKEPLLFLPFHQIRAVVARFD
jgi:hypothetical protein